MEHSYQVGLLFEVDGEETGDAVVGSQREVGDSCNLPLIQLSLAHLAFDLNFVGAGVPSSEHLEGGGQALPGVIVGVD